MMTELLSGYDKTTQKLMFRVYGMSFPDEEKRQNYRLAHLIALDVLGAGLYRDFGIQHGKIARTGLEKPQLLHEGLHMNLSHCRGLAVAAIGVMPLGVDAEAPRQVREKLLSRICGAGEIAAIQQSQQPEFTFTRFWTLKEAFGKYTGAGIRADFLRLPFSLDTGIVLDAPEGENLRFFQLIRENQYAVSLCIPNCDCQIVHDSSWNLIPDGCWQNSNIS